MEVVCFDLDDTLIPEVLFIKSVIRHIASWLSARIPTLPSQRIIDRMDAAVMTRQNHYSALESLLDGFSLRKAICMKDVVDEFRNHKPDPDIYHLPPSMRLVLNRLRNDPDVSTVLITDGRSITQRNKIFAAGLSEFFDDADIFISEETGCDKTHPDTFLHVMGIYAGAHAFHYVADNPPKDFLHPSRLGWQTHRAQPFPLMVHQGIPR